jgi:hypothetical protein
MWFLILVAMVFLLLKKTAGVAVAIPVAAAFFLGWSIFGRRAVKAGLIRADARTYYEARLIGADHDEALIRVIRYRYPFSPDTQTAVQTMFDNIMPATDEAEDVVTLVCIMRCRDLDKSYPMDDNDRLPRKVRRICRKEREKWLDNRK